MRGIREARAEREQVALYLCDQASRSLVVGPRLADTPRQAFSSSTSP